MLTVREIAWLAGLLEGEGCFRFQKAHTGYPALAIRLGMKDKDVVEQAAIIMNYGHRINQDRFSDIWHFSIYGKKAIGWMMTLYPFLKSRRKAKIRECLIAWRIYEKKYKEVCGNGHEMIEDNVGIRSNGFRYCKSCHRIWDYKRGRHSEINKAIYDKFMISKMSMEVDNAGKKPFAV